MKEIEMKVKSSMSYPATSLVPTSEWGDLDSHAHSVQFYEDDAFLLDELSRFIGAALGAGDASVVIATKPHRDGLARRLKARGLDVGLAARQGRYISLDAAATLSKFMLDGQPDPARFADLAGGVIERAAAAVKGERPRVVAFGEMVALLWAEGRPKAAIRLEHLWNDLARTHDFDLRCAYPMGLFYQAEDGMSIENVCSAHSSVIPAESYTSLASDQDRLRAIALLQQKARALETEIEERKNAEMSLLGREAELRQAVATRDEFLSVAAHELKTPITSLRGFAQLLLRDIRRKREVSPERLETALDAIERQTGKLSRLVARLLDTAQIEEGKLRIEPVPTDLVALVRSAISEQQGSANHRFLFDGPEHLEAFIDPVRFEQVVTNLLDNAVKFSPDGGTVAVELRQSAGGDIRLSISDEGLGIAPHEREAVFDRFRQAHDERHLSGMGLGLYITREIVELHGGSVGLEEPEHPGSRFVVTLPPSANGAQAEAVA